MTEFGITVAHQVPAPNNVLPDNPYSFLFARKFSNWTSFGFAVNSAVNERGGKISSETHGPSLLLIRYFLIQS